MRILITGASGLIGSALLPVLQAKGHAVQRLLRNPPSSSSCDLYWNPSEPSVYSEAFERFDAVIHLAGEGIASGRWSASKKRAIAGSRVQNTGQLVRLLSELQHPPRVVVSASAIGYYGDRGAEWLDETSSSGRGFLAEVCRAWEGAAQPIERCGVRLVLLRTGIVLSAKGGALATLLPPFRLGLGGAVGAGTQFMSWIALSDLIRAILFVLDSESLSGPLNATAPTPVTNTEFARTLGHVLGRPTILSVPARVLRILMGTEKVNELLLASARVRPARLLAQGFTFKFPELEPALREALEF